jgi:hypothetical protein
MNKRKSLLTIIFSVLVLVGLGWMLGATEKQCAGTWSRATEREKGLVVLAQLVKLYPEHFPNAIRSNYALLYERFPGCCLVQDIEDVKGEIGIGGVPWFLKLGYDVNSAFEISFREVLDDGYATSVGFSGTTDSCGTIVAKIYSYKSIN